MLLPYKLSKILKLKGHIKWRLISIIKIICSFGKVDQNIKKKRQQEHLNVLSHPFPMIFRNTFKSEWKYYEPELHFKTTSFSKDNGRIQNTEFWISNHKYFIPKYLQDDLIDYKGPDLNYFDRKLVGTSCKPYVYCPETYMALHVDDVTGTIAVV